MKAETEELLTSLTAVANKWGVAKPSLCSDYPVESAVRLTKGVLDIDFLYGPPEFRVEFALRDKTEPDRRAVGLGDLFKDPAVRNWFETHRSKASAQTVEGRHAIASQVQLLCQLIEETCAELFTNPKAFSKSTESDTESGRPD